MLHPHHDIIIAYLEGKDTEVYISDKDIWESLGLVTENTIMPLFHSSMTYRVKPNIETTTLQIYFSEEDNVHKTWSNSHYPNLRLSWLEGKLINAEVIK